MLEQDYLVRKDKNSIQLGGIMIGLALNSVYYYRENTGDPRQEVELSDKTIRDHGEEIAQEVVNRLRKMDNLKNVPITVALYKQAPKTSIVPGITLQKQKSKPAHPPFQTGMMSKKSTSSIRRIQTRQRNTLMILKYLNASKTPSTATSRITPESSERQCTKTMK